MVFIKKLLMSGVKYPRLRQGEDAQVNFCGDGLVHQCPQNGMSKFYGLASDKSASKRIECIKVLATLASSSIHILEDTIICNHFLV